MTGTPASEGLVNGEQVFVSIRPEKIHLTEHSERLNTFEGEIASTVYIGSNTHVVVHIGDVRLKVWEQNRISRLEPSSFYTNGQKVDLMLMPENTLVLKKD